MWALDDAGLGAFVAAVPAPLGVGRVTLADGSEVTGFLCEPYAVEQAADITASGGWPRTSPAPDAPGRPPGHRNDHKVAASSTSSTSPTTPITSPAATMRPSANTTPRQTTTTPSDGSVSRPENGGATNAPITNTRRATPSTDTTGRRSSSRARRGRAWRSNQRMNRNSLGAALPVNVVAELLPGQAARDPQLVTTDDHLQRDQAGEDLQHVGDATGRDRERGGQHQHHEHDGEAALVEHVGEGADGDVILLQQGLELIAQPVVRRLVAGAPGGLVHQANVDVRGHVAPARGSP